MENSIKNNSQQPSRSRLDPTLLADWQIAEIAERDMKLIDRLAGELGLRDDELLPMGRYVGKIQYQQVLDRLKNVNNSKYVDVTAITPTPLGEGKTTTTLGLVEGLGKIGKKVIGTIRQPSGGPTFNIKGSAAGGGLAQCIPHTQFSIRLTGDIDSITNAHNLAMVALTSRMQHEANYDDGQLAQRNLRRLNIDPAQVQIKWAIDFCAQALRNITIGKGGKMDGLPMESGFQISVSSELMAILAIAHDLADLRQRVSKMVVAYDKNGGEVTTADLEVDGAMTAWLVEAFKPNLMQTIEGQPILVHAGPFANIAIGQSSVIADRIAAKLCDYVITESGFGADIGYEKFWNLKCRYSGMKPDAVVIVATVRALKMHGGGPKVMPGMPLDEAYSRENLGLLEKGCQNLLAHIEIVKKSGTIPIVCVNRFYTDSDAEIALIKKIAEQNGAAAVASQHWLKGGDGAVELAEMVAAACQKTNQFRFLYDMDMPLSQRIELIAKEIYGASGVSYTKESRGKLQRFDRDPSISQLGTCMVKTQLSLSHNPLLKGRPTGWQLPIRDFLVYKGAGLIVPVTGDIKLLPGTGSDPAYRRIDVDVHTGKVQGLL